MEGQNLFNQVAVQVPKRSTFDMCYDNKMTLDFGYIIPTAVYSTLPGDTWTLKQSLQLKFNPLIAPIMHRVKVTKTWTFTPHRITYPDFDEYITGELEVLPPQLQLSSSNAPGKLADYLGYPKAGALNHETVALTAFRAAAYIKVYDEWYRDQNLIDEKGQDLTAGVTNNWLTTLITSEPQLASKFQDYITASLPFAQKGDTVTIPLLNTDVVSKGAGNVTGNIFRGVSDFIASTTDDVTSGSSGTIEVGAQGTHTIDPNGDWEVQPNLTPIENLRRAWAIQRWLELAARGGTRYIEWLKSNWNVVSSDKRFQRPEIIGSEQSTMVISEVLATAQDQTTGGNPIGQQAGHGQLIEGGNKWKFYCEEHGTILCTMTVKPINAYENQVPKEMLYESYLDWPHPLFANIGEQEVLNMEVYIGNETETKLRQTWGYQMRFAEAKYRNSEVHGYFRGDATGSLDFWHAGLQFSAAPALGEAFINCDPSDYDRIFAVDQTHNIYANIINTAYVNRALPKYAIPQ